VLGVDEEHVDEDGIIKKLAAKGGGTGKSAAFTFMPASVC